MKIAYLDCASGISGDMTLGALVDAGVNLEEIQQGVDSLAWPEGTPNCRFVAQTVKKCGFRATQVTVEHEPEHAHRHLHHITAMIDGSGLTASQKQTATAIFTRLGQAEAKAHGTSIEKVHFHEVGAVDSIADIVGAAIGRDLLGVDRIEASPIPTGTGFVQIAHGRCAIPAPATAELLKGIPLADFAPEGELTTPTGAAIAATLVDGYGPLPAMEIATIGYGAGQKEFEHPNLLRLIVGQATDNPTQRDSIIQLETNLDDSTGETLGHAIEQLWQAGALDVSTSGISMKKQRPGVLLSVQASPADADQMEQIIFRHTTALGVRRQLIERSVLPRESVRVGTDWGPITGIVATLPGGAKRFSPEYEACKQAAEGANVTLREVYLAAELAFSRGQ